VPNAASTTSSVLPLSSPLIVIETSVIAGSGSALSLVVIVAAIVISLLFGGDSVVGDSVTLSDGASESIAFGSISAIANVSSDSAVAQLSAAVRSTKRPPSL